MDDGNSFNQNFSRDIGPDEDMPERYRHLPSYARDGYHQYSMPETHSTPVRRINQRHLPLAFNDLEEDCPRGPRRGVSQPFDNSVPPLRVLGHPHWRPQLVEEILDETPSRGTGIHVADAVVERSGPGHSIFLHESERLKSFDNKWPFHTAPDSVQPPDLAREGFIYVGPDDRVKCVFCSTYLKHWDDGDSPGEEHRRHSPRCPKVLGKEVGNIPIEQDVTPRPVQVQQENPMSRFNNYFSRNNGAIGDYMPESRNSTANQQSACTINAPKPVFPDYSVESVRLSTFTAWPAQIKQKPEAMAKAGLFYLGKGDKVACYYCGNTLYAWEPEDDPWVEHAKHYSDCYFVQMVKGKEFIHLAKKGLVTGDNESNNLEGLQQTPAVLALKQEGYQMDKISQAINRMKARGDFRELFHAQAIMKEIMDIETEEETNAEEMQRVACKTAASTKTIHGQDDQPLNKDFQKLEEENQRLRDQRVCKICLEEEISVIFLPCGHLVCCASCALSIKDCPICRGEIKGTAKAFWS